MLRSMVFENFVHFEDRFHLDFSTHKDKPFFFIGSSSTGKTAVAELIRRCMSSDINTSLTNRADKTKLAYVFCEFELQHKNGEYGPNVITGLIIGGDDNEQGMNLKVKGTKPKDPKVESTKNEKDTEEDIIMQDKNEIEKLEDDLEFNKIIMYSYNGHIKIRTKTFYERKEGGKLIDSNKNVSLLHVAEPRMWDTKKIDDSKVEYILQEIREGLHNRQTDKKHAKLWDIISESFVGILSMRGLGSFQWTKSKFIGEEQKEKNYKSACQEAEIINELIDSEPNDSIVFKFLTSPNEFEFERKTVDNIVVRQRKPDSDEVKEFPLLKTPIGILEAKQFSLVIEHNKFRTITYEEPERGMHPQMIERMKEMLYDKCHNKTVIIITHCPDLIDVLYMKSTFVFFDYKVPSKISYGLARFDENELTEVSKICGEEHLKRIFFASRVLLVEGKSDKLIIQALFRYIFRNQKDCKDVDKILSHQIIPLDGWMKAKAVQNICNKIRLPCKSVFDRDVYVEVDGQGLVEIVKEFKENDDSKEKPVPDKDFDDFMEKPITDFLRDDRGFQKLSQKLKDKDEFIWKNGDLEDFLISDISSRKELCKLLKVGLTPTTRRKNLKKNIKKHLNAEISQENFETMAKILFNFEDTKRLFDFLAES